MNLINYLLTLLISFSGLIFGVILSNIALEEIHPVSKYLKYLNALLIISIVFIAISKINLLYAIISAIIMAVLILIFRNTNTDIWFYSLSGMFLGITAMYSELITIAVLAFSYGISIATLAVSEQITSKTTNITLSRNVSITKKILVKNSGFLLLGILSYAILSAI